jgi:hypothetical protein
VRRTFEIAGRVALALVLLAFLGWWRQRQAQRAVAEDLAAIKATLDANDARLNQALKDLQESNANMRRMLGK